MGFTVGDKIVHMKVCFKESWPSCEVSPQQVLLLIYKFLKVGVLSKVCCLLERWILFMSMSS